jgi:hypothetical protein
VKIVFVLGYFFGFFLCIGRAQAQGRDADAWDYLIQKVCVDMSGKVQPIDPYQCSNPVQYPQYAGYTIRNLRPGEPLPYHKVQTTGGELHDSYPAIDVTGRLITIHPFDYRFDEASNAQFGQYQPGKGYDVYGVRDGWVGAPETFDGAGFGTTFFGSDCNRGNGWIFFPVSMLPHMASGSATVPIHGEYWEHNGEPWPGWCEPETRQPDMFGHPLTTWQFIPRFAFGGMKGHGYKNSGPKYIDAIQSIHGFNPDSAIDPAQHRRFENFLAHGHLEAIYFTRFYGATRWENWRPTAQIAKGSERKSAGELANQVRSAANVCSVATCQGGQCPPITMNYRDVNFTLTACADTSGVESAEPLSPTPPIWPVPDLNLLRNFHFNTRDEYREVGQEIVGPAGGSAVPYWSGPNGSAKIGVALVNSRAPQDADLARKDAVAAPAGNGVRYLTLCCADADPSKAAIYQEVPISPATQSGYYTYGAVARAETRAGTGTLAFSLAELDAQGQVLSTASFTADVGATRRDRAAAPLCNRANFETGPGGPESLCGGTDVSVVRSSSFLGSTIRLTIKPNTTVLRFGIASEGPLTFDIVSAWLMRDDRNN